MGKKENTVTKPNKAFKKRAAQARTAGNNQDRKDLTQQVTKSSNKPSYTF